MAVLSDTDRARVRRGLARYWSRWWTGTTISKTDMRAAVNATDDFIDNNQGAYNQALPEEARTALTQTQKTLLFCAVALARVGILTLKCVFGEVD